MEFGKAEEEVGMDDETVGLGMIGSSSGRVRAETVDARSKGEAVRLPHIQFSLPLSSCFASMSRSTLAVILIVFLLCLDFSSFARVCFRKLQQLTPALSQAIPSQ
jgi:hypothetical protein